MPASYVYGQVSIDFEIKGGKKKVTATFHYRYYALEKKVEYVSIDYSDPALKEKIEGNPAIREKVNSYVSQHLAKKDERLSS